MRKLVNYLQNNKKLAEGIPCEFFVETSENDEFVYCDICLYSKDLKGTDGEVIIESGLPWGLTLYNKSEKILQLRLKIIAKSEFSINELNEIVNCADDLIDKFFIGFNSD